MATAIAEDTSHPWASYTDDFPLDRLLRAAGYKIVSRPAKGSTLWRDRTGKVMTFWVAVETVRK